MPVIITICAAVFGFGMEFYMHTQNINPFLVAHINNFKGKRSKVIGISCNQKVINDIH